MDTHDVTALLFDSLSPNKSCECRCVRCNDCSSRADRDERTAEAATVRFETAPGHRMQIALSER